MSRAIDSVLGVEGVEIIVLDNFSQDETPLLESKYKHYANVKWYRNSELLPVQANWNKAVSLASCSWVKLLQADDFLLEDGIQRILDLINQYSDYDFIGHYGNFVDGAGALIRAQQMHGDSPLSLAGPKALRMKLQQVYRFREPSSNLFRKSVWEKIGGYGSDRRFTFDAHFNVKIMAEFRSILIPERLVAVRRHAASDGAKLPARLALTEVITLSSDILKRMGPVATSADRRIACGWTQFRFIELLVQKGRRNPSEGIKFLRECGFVLLDCRGWGMLLQLATRRVVRGDLQGRVR